MFNLPQSFVSKYEMGEKYLTFTEVILICQVLELILLRSPNQSTQFLSNLYFLA